LRGGHNLGGELEIFEIGVLHGADVKEMAAAVVHLNGAVFDGEAARFFSGFPAGKVLAVKEHIPAGLLVRRSGIFC